ncbi:MAG: hypothetical protein HYW86_02905 [Candidatus Roizmanbacteria bacterium]|nr:MAG: hypothetical protein HYW86_02905 [Candidatus Roizmanbacteria bacterium]
MGEGETRPTNPLDFLKTKAKEIFARRHGDDLTNIFRQRAVDARNSLSSISDEKIKKTEHAIKIMAECIPEATLVGGWALRLYLRQRGLLIPTVPAIDIDFTIPPANYDQVREATRFPQETDFEFTGVPLSEKRKALITAKLRRKGEKEPVPDSMGGGYRNFMKSTKEEMALEDNDFKQHIDLFRTDEVAQSQKLRVDGVEVTVLTPEELLIRRFNQLNRYLPGKTLNSQQTIEIPRKILQYFYLNGAITHEKSLMRLWEERKAQGIVTDDYPQAFISLIEQIDSGISSGKVTLLDKYH